MSVDSILVRMAQLNSRKVTLDVMRKCLPKMRESSHAFSSRNAVPEYRYTNYDPELVKQDTNAFPAKSWKCRLPLTGTIRRSCLKRTFKEFSVQGL